MPRVICSLGGLLLFVSVSGCGSGAKELPPVTEGTGPKADQAKIEEGMRRSMEANGYKKLPETVTPAGGGK